jgi:hypothetical protein
LKHRDFAFLWGGAALTFLADRLGIRRVTASAALGFFVLAVLLRASRPRGFAAFEV